MCFCSAAVRRLQRCLCFQVKSFSCRQTPVWTFWGPRGGFHLSSADVAPWRIPLGFRGFQRHLRGTFGRGHVKHRGANSEKEPLSRQSEAPRSCQWDEMLIFHLRGTRKLRSCRPISHVKSRGNGFFNDLSPCAHLGLLVLDCFCCCLCIQNSKTHSSRHMPQQLVSSSMKCLTALEALRANICHLKFKVAYVTPVTFVDQFGINSVVM